MKSFFKLVAGAGLAISLMGTAGTATAAQTLRFTSQLPAKHVLGQNIEAFRTLVEERSKGELKIEIYDSGQLYKGNEVPQAVSSGAIDMGIVELGVYGGTVPAAGAFAVPFLFPSDEAIRKATSPDNAVRKGIDNAILETGARVIWWQAYGAVQMLSKKGPIRSPADLKNKKVRVLSKPIGSFIDDVGGVPIVIDGAEQVLAYQRGTVDVGMSGTTATQSRHMYEVMDYITMTNHSAVEFLVIMNDKSWNKLSPELQDIVMQSAREVETELRNSVEQQNLDAKTFLQNETSMEVVDLTPEEIEAWRKAAEPTMKRFAEESGELARQVVEAALAQ
ncbi:MAG: TRAP transporter substrate-binding protein DctP [Castellaniella sp.]